VKETEHQETHDDDVHLHINKYNFPEKDSIITKNSLSN
jgi:hypothetical protein